MTTILFGLGAALMGAALAVSGLLATGWRSRPVVLPTLATAKPLPVSGRNWVGLTTVEDVDDDTAATAFAALQQKISDGQHVDVVAGTSVEWMRGSTVHKTFRVV